jgi:thermitase
VRQIASAVLVLLAVVIAPSAADAQDPLRARQWNLDMVEADAAHRVTRGEGAVVAVIDTGALATHEDLRGRLLMGRDFVQDDSVPQDGNGHGTHIAGIVAANAGNGVGVGSVAPGATVLVVRVLDDDGSGDARDVARGIDYAAAQGAHVVNMSLGGDVPLVPAGGELDEAMDRALDAGVVLTAAAGNSGLPVCDQPSVDGRMLCVGSVDRRRMRSWFSNFGEGVDLVAPGGLGAPIRDEGILSTYLDPEYEEFDGTSQAAPHVSAVAGLLVSRGLRGQAVRDRLLATATDAGLPGRDAEYGAGIVNARAAVQGLPRPPGGSVSVRRVHRIRTVLRRGIRVRCRARSAGRCTATIKARGRTIAYGWAAAQPGSAVTLRAGVTREGLRLLRRVRRRLSARAEVAVPGSPTRIRRLTLRR